MGKRKSGVLDDLINNMDYKKFKALSGKEQKTITSKLVSAMNKRIKRLGQSEIGRLSPTYQAFERRGNQYYSVKGLSGDALYNRFEALQGSLLKATSVREWKKQRKETLEALNLDNLEIEDEKAFWNMYRKFQEDPSRKYKQYKKEVSNRILKYIASTFESRGYDYTEGSKRKLMKWLRSEYEKDKQAKYERNRERSASMYISDDESEEY